MSRAFVKEPDGDAAGDELPPRAISEHRNLVTPEGLAQMEAELVRLRDAVAAARTAEDRGAVATLQRDLNYWRQRRATAELVPPPATTDRVRFGHTVVLVLADGRELTYRIVGEDEADPAAGRISYVSPLATALLGQPVGGVASLGADEAEILAIKS